MGHHGDMTGSGGRRGAIDLARVGALVLVVLGHLTMAVIDRGPDGGLRGDNLLSLHPGLAWLAMLAPMPVFFAAAGWANATATPRTAAPRLRSLVGLGAVVVVVWSAAAVVALLATDDGGIVADGARIATQPLWFLAAYVPFAAFGAAMASAARHVVPLVAVCLAVLTALDAIRFAFDGPELVGWPGFAVAWAVPWFLGAAWRASAEHGAGRRNEVRTGLALAAGAGLAATALVAGAGYFPALIDAVEGERSNTSPPTLFTAVAAMVQVGLLMAVAGPLDRLATRWRRGLDRAGEAAVGIYAWHLTALALCAALLAAGLWTPERFGLTWWLTRPLWFALVLGVTAGLVAVTELVRRRGGKHPRSTPGKARILSGVVLATTGAAVVGRFGPRTIPGALAAVVGFVGGWWCLAGTRSRRRVGAGVEPNGQ